MNDEELARKLSELWMEAIRDPDIAESIKNLNPELSTKISEILKISLQKGYIP